MIYSVSLVDHFRRGQAHSGTGFGSNWTLQKMTQYEWPARIGLKTGQNSILSLQFPQIGSHEDFRDRNMNEGQMQEVVEAITVLALNGLYPKEAHKLLEEFLKAYSEREVYHKSPPIPQLGELCERAGKEARALERGSLAKREVDPEKKDDDGDDWKKLDEDEFVEEVRGRIDSEELVKEYEERIPEITELTARILSRLAKMSPTMRAHYQGEFMAMSKDLARDLNLDFEDDASLTLLILCLLRWEDDDDDEDEEEKPDLPKIGDLVTA